MGCFKPNNYVFSRATSSNGKKVEWRRAWIKKW